MNINKDILQFYQILIDNYVSNKNMKTIRFNLYKHIKGTNIIDYFDSFRFNAMKEIETIQEKSVIYAILLKDNRIAVTFSTNCSHFLKIELRPVLLMK